MIQRNQGRTEQGGGWGDTEFIRGGRVVGRNDVVGKMEKPIEELYKHNVYFELISGNVALHSSWLGISV